MIQGTDGRGVLGCDEITVVTGDKPSALAVSLISPGSLVDCIYRRQRMAFTMQS